jgi:autoinducer 2 (AI-2) kinase
MAIDAGTGSVRSVIFDTAGNQIGCVQKEWKHLEDPRFAGSMDFDWNVNWNLVCSCVRGVLAETGIDAKQIAAVSTTCMREGIVLYDYGGNEVWACANVDARAKDEVTQLKQIDPNLEKDIYLKSGQTFALGALPRLLWVKNKLPEIYKKTASVSMINDWIIFRLSGVMAVEPSNGSTTGFFDLKKRKIDIDIPRRCGLRDDIFPEVVECGNIVAKVSKKGEAESGLAEGTPLVAGGGDCQLGTIGVGVVEEGDTVVFGGSFWQYEFNVNDGKCSPKCDVRVNCHAVSDLWQYEAIAFFPGLVMRWFRDAFCTEEIRIAAQKNIDPYQILDEAALSVPAGSYALICTFSDVMNYINWKHASPSFINFELDADKFNKASFYRAIMENSCLVTLGHLKLVEEATGKSPEKIVFAGLNCRKQVFCVMQNRYSPPSVWIKALLESGRLGKIYMVQLHCYWNRDERYYHPDSWHGTVDLDGGTLFTQFSHFIDIMYWLFGDITDIQARFADYNHAGLTDFEDSGVIHFRFTESDAIGSLNYSTSVWDKNLESSMLIIAENGSVKIGGQYMDKVEYCHIRDYQMPELAPTNPGNDYGFYKGSAQNHHLVIRNVVDVLSSNAPSQTIATNVLEGLKVVNIIERIYAQKQKNSFIKK